MMIGRKVELVTKEPKTESELHSPVILSMKNFHVEMPGELVKGIDLEVREGEILGIGGLAGHGKVGIANGIMGLYPASGEVLYRGETLSVEDTLSTLKKKIMFVSEDRRGVGLNLDASIEMNTVIAALRVNQEYLRHIGFMRFYNKKAAAEYAKKNDRRDRYPVYQQQSALQAAERRKPAEGIDCQGAGHESGGALYLRADERNRYRGEEADS